MEPTYLRNRGATRAQKEAEDPVASHGIDVQTTPGAVGHLRLDSERSSRTGQGAGSGDRVGLGTADGDGRRPPRQELRGR